MNTSEPIHFEHVNDLDLITTNAESIEQLSFSHLDSLSFRYQSKHSHAWIEFFKRHRNLSNLCLIDGFYGNECVPLASFTVELPMLIEMELESYNILSVDVIGKLFDEHKHLQKFRYLSERCDKRLESDFRNHFKNEWIIQAIKKPHKGLEFIKKSVRIA